MVSFSFVSNVTPGSFFNERHCPCLIYRFAVERVDYKNDRVSDNKHSVVCRKLSAKTKKVTTYWEYIYVVTN